MTPPSGNLGDIFAHHGETDRVALIDLHDPAHPREVSYGALNAACDGVAAGLRAAGLRPGQRVAILALNRVEFLEVLFGAMRAGCVPVMINVKLPVETIRFILDDCGAPIVFADAAFAGHCPAALRMVVFPHDGTAVARAEPYEDFRKDKAAASYRALPGDIAEQPYTSGSTGRPKGVLLDHGGQIWMVGQLVASRAMTADDCSVISAPLYHKNALLAIKSGLAAGGRIVLFAHFDAVQYITAIARWRLTLLTGVPTMYALMLGHEKLLADTDKSSVRAISMGSAPASDMLLDRVAAAFPGVPISLNYGVTEGGPILFAWSHPEGRPRPRMSVGWPLPGVEIRLVGGKDDDHGVLHVRSPGVLAGYHNLPDETARRLRDGWYDTGDLLRRDGQGWYYFVGRVDDMFVCAGENIYPGEVEVMLERHPDILQAVVVPAPNALKAHVPYAFVVARPGAALDEAGVKAYALANGPAYAHPRRAFLVAALPLSGTNKIDRKALERRAAEAAGAEAGIA
jgi:long-chain acyl-CoA synthetase